jgi:hypothetical protein
VDNSTIKLSARQIRRWGRRLKAFRRRHGHSRVPVTYSRDPGLARWCAQTRRDFHRLPVQRLKELLGLRFNFGWDLAFVVGFCALADFKRGHGHCNVPFSKPGNPRLAYWVRRQRSVAHRLSDQRRHLLERLGFDWHPYETYWEQHYAELCKFHRVYGHCRVPQRGRTAALSAWVVDQRGRWHHPGREGPPLSYRQKQLLDKLGFDWVPIESRWQTRLAELQAYQRRYGVGKVPSKERSPVLAAWLTWQRKRRAMPAVQRRKLEGLGIDWHPVQNHWQRRYRELSAFKQQFGSCSVPQGWPPNPGLGNWVGLQRERRQCGTLPPAQRRLLDKLGFDWVGNPMPPRKSWEERFRQLRDFKQRFGHCQVPALWTENIPLGSWVRHQRVLHKRGKLPAHKRRLLEELGFRWSVARRIYTASPRRAGSPAQHSVHPRRKAALRENS